MVLRRREPELPPRLAAILRDAGPGPGRGLDAGGRGARTDLDALGDPDDVEALHGPDDRDAGGDRGARSEGGEHHAAGGGWVPDRPVVGSPGGTRGPRHASARGSDDPAPEGAGLPDLLRRARATVTLRAVGGALLVLVLAVLGFGARVVWADHRAEPVGTVRASGAPAPAPTGPVATDPPSPGAPELSQQGSTPPVSVSPAASSPTTGAVEGPSARVVVHVVGQVRRPGVVTLATGARVADAVAAAGGPTRRARLAAVNLARVLVDGEQVRVPRPGQHLPGTPAGAPAGVAGAGGSTAPGPGGGAAPVDLNTADDAALEALPGVGPVLAQRILAWRTEHGRFTDVEELGEVSGIGEKTLAELRALVTV